MPTQRGGTLPHNATQSGRVPALDAIRGIAAVTVVFHHWRAISQSDLPPWYAWPFFAGHEAVIFFFVLSGYVLSLPYWRGRQLPYPEYLVRRFFRIYVPFLVALIVSYLACLNFFGTHLNLTEFYAKTWHTQAVPSLFFNQLVMPGDPSLNGAFWSLRYEMEMSIIFPLVCALLVRLRSFLWLIPVIGLRAVQMLLVHNPTLSGHVSTKNVAGFLYYSTFFIVGGALARDRVSLTRLASLLPRALLWLSFLAGLALYFNRMFVHLATTGNDLLSMAGASLIIVLVQDPRLKVGLNSAVPQYLGRISYSMYLIHCVVLFALFDLFYESLSTWKLALLVCVVTLVAAHVFCIAIEEPSMVLGKHLSKRLDRAVGRTRMPAIN